MASNSESQAMQWLTKYSCSQPGVLPPLNDWNVEGFYEDKFDDPWNLNLDENVVSLITAIATSFSIILFVDILFRVLLRGKNCRVTPEMVQRRLVLENFSNPINLLSYILGRIAATCSEEFEDDHPQSPFHKLSKRRSVYLAFMGGLTVMIEFMFIFLATNQNKVLNLRLDTVPIFEFEDRGCEFLRPPAFDDSCYQIPLTEKSGFDSRASIQVFSTTTGDIFNASRFSNSSYFTLQFSITNVGDGIGVTTMDRNTKHTQTTRMGVFLEQSGKLYHGMQNVSSQEILSALVKRLDRTNVTVLANITVDGDAQSESLETTDFRLQLQSPSNMVFTTPLLNVTVVSVVVDVSNLDLRETHLSLIITGEEDDFRKHLYMHSYLKDVMHSIMFPTGGGRGVIYAGDEFRFLDEDNTPLAYYNRPWIGVLPSLIICCTLLLTWIVLAALRIEGDIDSQKAWEKFFKDTEESNIEVSERIGEELQAKV
ncbi:hypothetical protein FGB62_20g115 [Gracilaria domingensis]|nr:hypothetical protein FGB62_20g115 [Gracilaria domingensis]